MPAVPRSGWSSALAGPWIRSSSPDAADENPGSKPRWTIARSAMDLLDVDPGGFDLLDRRLLLLIIERFDGGPVGVESLAASLGEERGTIEDVIEAAKDRK